MVSGASVSHGATFPQSVCVQGTSYTLAVSCGAQVHAVRSGLVLKKKWAAFIAGHVIELN